jgi:hypothetical protein
MKILVMKPKNFFKIRGNMILLGGSLEYDIKCGELVEVHTPKGTRMCNITEIKCYKDSLPEALEGLSCGLMFAGIDDMTFRISSNVPNPFDPKENMEEYCAHLNQDTVAEGVLITKNII